MGPADWTTLGQNIPGTCKNYKVVSISIECWQDRTRPDTRNKQITKVITVFEIHVNLTLQGIVNLCVNTGLCNWSLERSLTNNFNTQNCRPDQGIFSGILSLGVQ